MIPLHFNLQLVQFLADRREAWLTGFFTAASFSGSANGYILLIILVYTVWDKRFAVRLSVLVLLAMSLNELFKLFLKNPRPFVHDGTYLNKWAISPAAAKAFAAEYSTPSGHAMGSSAFYSYFFTVVRNRFARLGLALIVVFIGVSRPYLGVHYAEDVLLGWALGLPIAFAAIRFTGRLTNLWRKCSYAWQIALAVAVSLTLWLLVAALNGGHIDNQVRGVAAYSGFLTGIVIACPLELRLVNFDSRGSEAPVKLLCYSISLGVMAIVLLTFNAIFAAAAGRASILDSALAYLRYAVVGVAGMFLAPLAFCKLKLAETESRAVPAGIISAPLR